MSVFDDQFMELQDRCRDVLVCKSHNLRGMRPDDNEGVINEFVKAVRSGQFRSADHRHGLTSDELAEMEQRLASEEIAGEREEFDVTDADDIDEDLYVEADDEFLAADMSEERLRWNTHPRIYAEYGREGMAHYLVPRGSRSALFDVLELEITKYLAEESDYPECELDRAAFYEEKRKYKQEMAERLVHLLHYIGEAMYSVKLQEHHAQSNPPDNVIGYSRETEASARRSTNIMMKGMLNDEAHFNLDDERTSIRQLLEKTLGHAAFKAALDNVYRDQTHVPSAEFLSLLSKAPARETLQ